MSLKKPIFLVGFSAAGKTTVAKILSEELRLDHVDLDSVVESTTGKNTGQLFSENGQDEYRELEYKLLKKLVTGRKISIYSLAGGSVIKKENRNLIRKKGIVVWLATSPKTVFTRLERVGKSHLAFTPLMNSLEAEKFLEMILMFRNPYYESVADLVISTDDLNPNEISSLIKSFITG